ncbi:MAG: TIGR00730 family Rossman fold protein, partial [Bacteroidetes bacterium]
MKKSDEEKIRNTIKAKTWNEIKTYDSWQIFKIMYEFVKGFER